LHSETDLVAILYDRTTKYIATVTGTMPVPEIKSRGSESIQVYNNGCDIIVPELACQIKSAA